MLIRSQTTLRDLQEFRNKALENTSSFEESRKSDVCLWLYKVI